jgi:hypothetical protein
MRIALGYDDLSLQQEKKQPVYCDYSALVNAHMLIMGKTGMGKTTFLLGLIKQIQRQGQPVRIHIMDVHGDLDVTGASSIRFSESSDYGLNPFILSADPHFGGVRKRIQDIIYTINACDPIGPRQQAVMRNLFTDLYAANGFYIDNPGSWSLNDHANRTYPKRFPAMDDACRFAYGKLKQLIIGADSKSSKALEELNKVTSKLYKLSKKTSAHNQAPDELLELSMKYRQEALQAYTNYITHLETGKELEDFIKYDAKEVIRSVVDRFDNLKATGVFKAKPPPFHPGNTLWHYDITALRDPEKQMFVEFRLQEIFAAAVESGHLTGPSHPPFRDLVIIDEAHLFFRDDANNILNTIAKEGRKFGIGLVCASQSPTHFSDDFFGNVASKFVLGIDQMYWNVLMRKMKVSENTFKLIKPFEVIAVQMTNKGEVKSKTVMVRIGNHPQPTASKEDLKAHV